LFFGEKKIFFGVCGGGGGGMSLEAEI